MDESYSHEDLDLSDAEPESEPGSEQGDEDESFHSPASASSAAANRTPTKTLTPPSLDVVDAQLRSLKLKYSVNFESCPSGRWIVFDKTSTFSFVKPSENSDNEGGSDSNNSPWFLKVRSKVQAKVGLDLQLKSFPDQRRVDFVTDDVWAIKFAAPRATRSFTSNGHGVTSFELQLELS